MSPDEELDALYAELPKIDCQGHCHTACGPIDMSTAERKRIRLTYGVNIPVGSALRDGPSDCVALTWSKQCSVYDVRPLICRIYGLTKGLPCAYGCRPDRWLSEREFFEFLARAYDISGEKEMARTARMAADPKNADALKLVNDQVAAETHRRWFT